MFQVTIQPHLQISQDSKAAPLDTAALLELLVAIQQTGSIAQATQTIGLSYRYAWGLLRDVEKFFGNPLIDKGRGRGTVLTPLAEKLIWANRRVTARLSPMLESLSNELEGELNKIATEKAKNVRLHASHGFAVEALLRRINRATVPIELRYRNSTDAVVALSRQECDLAGFHVPIGEFERPAVALYGQWLNPKTHCLIHLAVRSQGLFVAAGNPHGITSLQEVSRSGVRFVNRQVGSGTRMLLELMLAGAGLSSKDINGFDDAEFTHSAVAAFIASGMAEVGFGVQTAAERFGLAFIPLVQERYFFALPVAALQTPLVQQVINIVLSDAYRAEVNALPGYDATDTGKIRSLAQAFEGDATH